MNNLQQNDKVSEHLRQSKWTFWKYDSWFYGTFRKSLRQTKWKVTEYINSFYLEFEDENEGDDFEYYLKSNVRYYFPMPFKYSLTSNSFTESINDDEFEKIPDNY